MLITLPYQLFNGLNVAPGFSWVLNISIIARIGMLSKRNNCLSPSTIIAEV